MNAKNDCKCDKCSLSLIAKKDVCGPITDLIAKMLILKDVDLPDIFAHDNGRSLISYKDSVPEPWNILYFGATFLLDNLGILREKNLSMGIVAQVYACLLRAKKDAATILQDIEDIKEQMKKGYGRCAGASISNASESNIIISCEAVIFFAKALEIILVHHISDENFDKFFSYTFSSPDE